MSFLDEIVSSTRQRVDNAKRSLSDDDLRARATEAGAPQDFRGALAGEEMSLIGEIKRATPAMGDIAPDLDAKQSAEAFARGGAAAVSVLTEPQWFKGRLEDVSDACAANLPILFKDFVIDTYQVHQARAAGADAVLVIVRIAPGDLLAELLATADSLGMDALVEVYDETDMKRAGAAGADLIGINHRDLATFEVDPSRTARLAPGAPEEAIVVALSGVHERKDVEAMRKAGADAVLVGQSLVTSSDPAAKVGELLGR